MSTTCVLQDEVKTFYNGNPNTTPYVGIMFQMNSKTAFEIQTLELDVRTEQATDLGVEVYYIRGDYNNFYSSSVGWVKVFDGNALVTNDASGVILPWQNFQSITMAANQRLSLYITMKGPWLDFVSNQFFGTNEIFYEDSLMSLRSGSGLIAKFGKQLDNTYHPQFAGAIHYKTIGTTQQECGAFSTNTTVVYQFIVDREISAGIQRNIRNAVQDTVDSKFSSEVTLLQYNNSYDLQIVEGANGSIAIDYNAQCPDGWTMCPSLKVSMILQHLSSLDDDTLLNEMYKFNDDIMNRVRDDFVQTRVVYVGLEQDVADFDIVLHGTPAGEMMDSIQREYFSTATKEFLNRVLPFDVRVLDVNVEDQLAGRRKLLRQLAAQSASIELTGKINGVRNAYVTRGQFAGIIQNIASNEESRYLTNIKTGLAYPGPFSENNRWEYFENISRIESSFVVSQSGPASSTTINNTDQTHAPSSSPEKNIVDTLAGVNTIVWIAAGAALLALVLLILVCCCYSRRRSKEKSNKGNVDGKSPLSITIDNGENKELGGEDS